jgi:transposase
MALDPPSPHQPSSEDELRNENARLRQRIAELEHQIKVLTNLVYGRSSEKARPLELNHPQQNILFPELLALQEKVEFATSAAAPSEPVAESKNDTRPSNKRRSTFPEQLPRVRTVLELSPEERRCAQGHEMIEMGSEITQELERVEVMLVHEVERKKYICRQCQEGVKIADGPLRVIEKGLLGRDALAWLLTERFFNHLPYHRLERKLEAEGVSVSRSLMCESVGTCADLLKPVFQQLVNEVKEQEVVGSDDTGVTIQQTTRGGPKTAYLWVYGDRDGRAVFDFTLSRNRDGPKAMLKGMRGYLQVDACGLYDDLVADGAIEVGCWAHARRGFVKAEDSDPALAQEAIRRIAMLYAIETHIEKLELDTDRVRGERQRLAVPVLNDLFDWLTVTKAKVLDKSPMGKAIQYAINQEKHLRRYVEHGALEIDNNRSERNLRTIAVGRKNWVFIGNENYGHKAAVLYSLIVTCHNIGIDPRLYLRDVLVRISKTSDAKSLTPHNWKQRCLAEATQERDAFRARILSSLKVAPSAMANGD